MSFLRRWVGTMDRRELLHLFGWVATTVAGSPVLGSLNTDEQERVAKAVTSPSRVDEQVIAHIDDILWAAKANDDRLGPQAALATVLAQRQMIETMLPDCPDRLRPQLLSVLSNASRSAGWMYLNSDDLGNAQSFYEEARVAAHEAQNTELASYVLCFMSGIGAQFGPGWARSRVDIDHAVAAESWAQKTDNTRLKAFAATIVSRAFSVVEDNAECMRGLERAHSYLASFNGSRTRVPGNFDEAGLMSHRGQCLLRLGRHREAASALGESLSGLDQSYVRVTALTKIDLAKANIQDHDIDGAAGAVGEAAELATTNRSPRSLKRLRDVRADLAPWQDARAVRELDTRLAGYRLA
jgi:tetratricopeptide (TPR) repeat protein